MTYVSPELWEVGCVREKILGKWGPALDQPLNIGSQIAPTILDVD